MKQVNFLAEEDIEMELRNRIRGRGDLSRIINNALREYFKNHEVGG